MTLGSELHELFREDWEWEMQDNPEFAIQAGVFEAAVGGFALQDVSPQGYLLRKQHSEEMVIKVQDIILENDAKLWRMEQMKTLKEAEKEQLRNGAFGDKWREERELLTPHEKLLADLFKGMHNECQRNISVSKMHLMPLNSMGVGGALYSFVENVELMRFESTKDYRLYLVKLEAFHWQIDMFIASLKEGLSQGIVSSRAVARNVEEQLAALIQEEPQALLEPLNRPFDASVLPLELRDQLLTAVQGTKKGFKKFLDFFQSEYAPKLRNEIGCSSLPNGPEIYQTCLNFHTTTTLAPDDIHNIGLAEVAAIEERFNRDVLVPLGFQPGEFSKFVEDAQKNEKFYVSTPEQLKYAYETFCAKISDTLPDFFHTFPKSSLSIKCRDFGPAAYYLAGTSDGTRPGTFYVNVSNIGEKPLYVSTIYNPMVSTI